MGREGAGQKSLKSCLHSKSMIPYIIYKVTTDIVVDSKAWSSWLNSSEFWRFSSFWGIPWRANTTLALWQLVDKAHRLVKQSLNLVPDSVRHWFSKDR